MSQPEFIRLTNTTGHICWLNVNRLSLISFVGDKSATVFVEGHEFRVSEPGDLGLLHRFVDAHEWSDDSQP